MEQILISKENLSLIIKGFTKDLYNKINNKDLSTPYIEQFKKAGLIKTDGNGDMFLCNNGEYIKIDLNSIEDINNKIQTIYDLFKITENKEYKWETNNLPITSQASTSQVYNNKIYSLSGYGEIAYKVLIQDIKTKTWSYGHDVSNTFYYGTSEIYNGKIYCFAGCANNETQIYDIETDTWSLGKPIDNGYNIIYYTSSVIDGDNIYVVGGTSSEKIMRMYNIPNNSWSTKAIPVDLAYHISKLYKNKIYCISSTHHKIYDIETNAWSDGSLQTIVKSCFVGQIYKNILYCVGGSTTDITTYDFKHNLWSKIETVIPSKLDRMSSVLYNNKMYLLGGFNGSDPTKDGWILSLPLISYDIKLPEELDNKLNIIKSDGLGNKLLADNGTYIDPSNKYTPMTTEEILSLIEEVKNENGGV